MDYFIKFLKIAPFSHALWRTQEASALKDVTLAEPILDIGCGFGEFGEIFYKEKQIRPDVGLDISARDLLIASRKDIYKTLVNADARSMPLGDAQFATCLSISVLEHIEGVKEALKEIHRVLRPGGRLLFTVPTRGVNDALGFSTERGKIINLLNKIYLFLYHRAFKHKTLYTEEEWRDSLLECGFEVIEVRNTLNKSHLKYFQMFLPFAMPSQIIRLLVGSRAIISSKVRMKLFSRVYSKICHNIAIDENYNVLIFAQKKCADELPNLQ